MGKRSNTGDFITKATLVHGDTYDYNKVVYVNSRTKITIMCKTHGEFLQRPDTHLASTGCPKCATERGAIQTVSSLDTFITKAKVVHNDLYTYSNAVYINSRTKIDITCKIHGDFQQKPKVHLEGYGCTSCVVGGFDQTKPAVLYYLCVCNSVYKIGVTNRSVTRRFCNTDLAQIVVLEEVLY